MPAKPWALDTSANVKATLHADHATLTPEAAVVLAAELLAWVRNAYDLKRTRRLLARAARSEPAVKPGGKNA
jgi:hypothetical protein